MTQTRQSPGGDSRAPSRSFAATETSLALPEPWHLQAEWEAETRYAQGFRDGVRHAQAVMQEAIVAAIDPGPAVNPGARQALLSRTSRDVVAAFVESLYRAERRPSGPPARPEYSGGPVVWQEAA